MPRKLTQEEVINRFESVHGCKRYDYSCVEYKDAHSHVDIICKIHGLFRMTPHHHKKGFGCRKCEGHIVDRESFVFKSNIIHNNKYNYDLVDYQGGFNPVMIICPKHGVFKQKPKDHIQNRSCRKCGEEKVSGALRADTDDVIEKCKAVHGNKYSYHLVNYVNETKKVDVFCHKHGVFQVSIGNHLYGKHGCKKCHLENAVGSYNDTNMQRRPAKFKNKECFFYIFLVESDRAIYKLGISSDPKRRINYCNGKDKDILFKIKSNVYDCFYLEQEVFDVFCKQRTIYGLRGGRTEHFFLSEQDIDYIKMLSDFRLNKC